MPIYWTQRAKNFVKNIKPISIGNRQSFIWLLDFVWWFFCTYRNRNRRRGREKDLEQMIKIRRNVSWKIWFLHLCWICSNVGYWWLCWMYQCMSSYVYILCVSWCRRNECFSSLSLCFHLSVCQSLITHISHHVRSHYLLALWLCFSRHFGQCLINRGCPFWMTILWRLSTDFAARIIMPLFTAKKCYGCHVCNKFVAYSMNM